MKMHRQSYWGVTLIAMAAAASGMMCTPFGEGGERITRRPAKGETESSGNGGAGGAGGSTSSATSSGGGGAEAPIPPELCRFDSESTFTLPSAFDFDQIDDLSDDSSGLCVEGELSFNTIDINGDLQPDLVVADNCDIDGVGTTHWRVFLNQGDGFSDTELTWTLPAGFATDQLDDLADDSGDSCVEGELSFATRDMNGDLLPDLVVTDHCDIAGVGTDQWHVYLNIDGAFDQTPLNWPLPEGFGTDQLDDLSDDSGASCAEGELSYALIDMNGDMQPDLVITDQCDLAGVGTEHWLVYLNNGAGFSSSPTLWAIPGGYTTDQLDDTATDDSGSCAEGELSYATVDMTGDMLPDLVVTDRCDIDGIGSDGWLVYQNLGDGFAAQPEQWALPAGFATDQLDDITTDDSGSCVQGELSYALRDGDGDQLPDLIVTDNCDLAGVGTTHWLFYKNLGSGFDEARAWMLPTAYDFDSLDDMSFDSASLCIESELSGAAIDMSGDQVLELMIADDCDLGEIGTTHWRMFAGSCTTN